MKRETAFFRMHGYDNKVPVVRPPQPQWETDSIKAMKGFCIWCGSSLPKGYRSYCPPTGIEHESDCKWHATHCGWSTHTLQVESLRHWVHIFNQFECQHCHVRFFKTTPAGVILTIFGGIKHHIVPLENGGTDTWENLTVLCEKCHDGFHYRGLKLNLQQFPKER